MESELQNGREIFKLSKIYLNKQGPKKQCQLESDQPNELFCSVGKKLASNTNDVSVNPNLR